MYTKQSADQIAASNQFFSYRRGWVDGAKSTAMSKVDTSQAYSVGYTHGWESRKIAMAKAADTYGYKQSIIRAEGNL